MRAATGMMLGRLQLAVPLALVTIGYVLVRGRPREEPVRVAIGWGFLTIAACGIAHLASGLDRWDATGDELRRAGGWLGLGVAQPLRSVLALWGAALVLVVIGGLGALVLVKVRVRDAVNRTAASARPSARGRVPRRAALHPRRRGGGRTGARPPAAPHRRGARRSRRRADGLVAPCHAVGPPRASCVGAPSRPVGRDAEPDFDAWLAARRSELGTDLDGLADPAYEHGDPTPTPPRRSRRSPVFDAADELGSRGATDAHEPSPSDLEALEAAVTFDDPEEIGHAGPSTDDGAAARARVEGPAARRHHATAAGPCAPPRPGGRLRRASCGSCRPTRCSSAARKSRSTAAPVEALGRTLETRSPRTAWRPAWSA